MAYTTINKPSNYFDTKLYTGTGATQSVSGLNFSPDLVWIKNRSGANSHGIVNSLRDTRYALDSSSGAVETDFSTSGVTSLNSSGFTVATHPVFNGSGNNYVSWNWDGNGAGVSNTAGTISSTVSANTTSGFSIVTYTSPNSSSDQTVGHGLGVAPSFIITKNIDTAFNWDIYHKGLSSTYGLTFTSDAQRGPNVFGSMTSTTFGTKTSYTHNSTHRYVAYCFAEVKGFSKIGRYNGTGAVDGTFVYTGFKPAFVLIKRFDGAGNWIMFDNKRPNYNVIPFGLFPNLSNAEVNDVQYYGFDLLSNGFKIRNTVAYGGEYNDPGAHVYMAFAEQPLVGTNNVPATAR